jgi:hypothetical protein
MSQFLFGLKLKREREESGDVTKLFFDSFSSRVSEVEEEMRVHSAGLGKLKNSLDQGRISDLVLLERLQGLESRVKECMEWIVKVAERAAEIRRTPVRRTFVPLPEASEGMGELSLPGRMEPSRIVSPVGLVGSIQSLTTGTELGVLALLGEQGPKSAPEIGRHMGRSREHTARLMKKLLDEGYVLRDQARIPYRYSLSERVRQGMARRAVSQDGEQEVVSNPPA